MIRDLSIGDSDLASRIGEAWIDKALSEIVTVESRGKVESMMKVSPGDGLTWQEINHVVDGEDLPVRYVAVRLDAAGQLVVLGRDLRGLARLQQQLVDTNLTIERDYALHRSAETQFRMLFQTSTEAMLIADAATRKITDINPAAEDQLHRVARRLVGSTLEDLFVDENADAVGQCLATVRALGLATCPGAPPPDVGS